MSAKAVNRDIDRRIVNAAIADSVRIRHGYDRSVGVSHVTADNDDDFDDRCEDC